MAYAGRVVDVVRTQIARDLLRCVIGLVRQTARGQVDPDPLGCGGADPRGYEVERVVPAHAAEPDVAAAAEHRVRKATERAQCASRPRELRDVTKQSRIQGARRVELEQVEARGAEVHALHRPIAKARDAEGAAVAHPL